MTARACRRIATCDCGLRNFRDPRGESSTLPRTDASHPPGLLWTPADNHRPCHARMLRIRPAELGFRPPRTIIDLATHGCFASARRSRGGLGSTHLEFHMAPYRGPGFGPPRTIIDLATHGCFASARQSRGGRGSTHLEFHMAPCRGLGLDPRGQSSTLPRTDASHPPGGAGVGCGSKELESFTWPPTGGLGLDRRAVFTRSCIDALRVGPLLALGGLTLRAPRFPLRG